MAKNALGKGLGALLLRVAEHAFGITLLDDHAAVHEDDAVRHRAGEGHLVRDDDHGHLLLRELADDLEHLARELGVEGARRLVEEQQLRVQRKGPRDGDALLLPAGELAGVGIGLALEAHLLQEGRAALEDLVLLASVQERRLSEVFHDRVVREEVEALEHEPEARAELVEFRLRGVDAGLYGVLSVVEDVAAVRRLEKRRAAQQRTFAGARGADDRDDVAGLDGHGDVLQHVVRGEGFLHAADLEDRGFAVVRKFFHVCCPHA